jgi:F0F1-type ATP synthase assembly protein I
MKALLGLLAIYLLINLGLIGLGVGIGFLLHRMLPSVDLGMGILIGVVATGFSIHYYARLMKYVDEYNHNQNEYDDPLLPSRIVVFGSPRAGRKRKGKQS